jgi:hypothetical protein
MRKATSESTRPSLPSGASKGWSRAKKEAYIRGDFETLTALSLVGA